MEGMNSSDDSLLIRAMAPQDAEAVAQLSHQLGYEVSTETVKAHIAWLAEHPQQTALVACLENEVVGCIEASIMRNLQLPPYAFLEGFVVSEKHRSLGIGKKLYDKIEVWCSTQNVHHLRVGSRVSREGAHRFYLREGFQQIKTWAVFEKVLP